jgi:hypothetical protein
MLVTGQPLFLDGNQQLPVRDDTGGGIMVEIVNPENIHVSVILAGDRFVDA